MKDDDLIRFANKIASTQTAKDITDFYNNLPNELSDEHRMELIKLEFYGEYVSYNPADDLFDIY